MGEGRLKSRMQTQELYDKAIRLWGPEAQLLMAVEECNELSVGILHFLRGRCHLADIAEEVADVTIMMEQITAMMPGRVYRQRLSKLERLSKRLERAEERNVDQ